MGSPTRAPLGLVLALCVFCTCQTTAQAGLAAATVSTAAHPHVSRYVVGFDAAQKQQLKQQLQEHGYQILTEGSGFLTVTHPAAPEARASHDESGSSSSHRRRLNEAAHQQHTQRLGQLPGVHSSEQDVRRHLHIRPSAPLDASSSRTLQAADSSSSTGGLSKLLGPWHTGQVPHGRTAYMQWGAEVVDATCAAKDEQLQPQVPNSEVLPWGIKEVGAWNPDLQKLTPKGRTIVCVIDSGLWGGHPEYRGGAAEGSPQNTFSGCQDSGSCPFEWKSDVVGHGTHVTGTIGAPHNGVGVVGVMSQGAEVHVVRVWNNSGDVSQGQGPYATDLVLAYSHCLSHLKAEQAAEKSGKKVNMVINMSFGSAGPLTVERMWIERAAKRGDVLFVGSAGNNGSFLDVGKRAAGPASLSGQSGKEPVGQYLSYPASYSLNEMLSVANARCDGSIEFTSQKNKQVSISAPGMAILSSVPREMGIVRGHLSSTAQVKAGTTGNRVGYSANGFLEPRPIQGGSISTTPSLPLVSCSAQEAPQRMRLFGRKPAGSCAAAKGALCFMELPGKGHLFEETCTAMAHCMKGGGAGLVVWKSEKSAEADAFYSIPATQLDCGPKCKCWADLKASLGCSSMGTCSSKALPGVIISSRYAAALKAAGAGKGDVKASVAVYEYPYKYFDGTSMAAPHVTGAAALIWRQFPDCKAADIAHALKMSAQWLPGQLQVPDYAGGYGMLKVDKAYEWVRKNSPCAQHGIDAAVAA